MKESWHYLNLEGSWDYLIGCVGIVGFDMAKYPYISHMWGKLSLPMFLFNVGLLTLIKIGSLILKNLIRFLMLQNLFN